MLKCSVVSATPLPCFEDHVNRSEGWRTKMQGADQRVDLNFLYSFQSWPTFLAPEIVTEVLIEMYRWPPQYVWPAKLSKRTNVFRFTDLPAEIRNLIYSHLLIFHEPNGQDFLQYHDPLHSKLTAACLTERCTQYTPSPHTQILGSCQLIHDEATYILQRSNLFGPDYHIATNGTEIYLRTQEGKYLLVSD